MVAIRPETATAKSFRLRLAHPRPHLPGQHYVIRLRAPDGYTASRSYSVASAPDASGEVEFTIERLPGGEVSGFLHDGLVVGDDLEVRGPIGGWFVWRGDGPALLVGGGSGLVPLMAMLRFARANGASHLVRLVVSVRSPAALYYAAELPGPETTVVYTRSAPAAGARPPGHLRVDDVAPLLLPEATVYVCGSARFADAATDVVLAAGVATERIRVERFGPSG